MSLEDEYLFKEEAKRKRFSLRSLFVALIGAIIGGLIVVILVPYLLGSNPVDFFSSRNQKVRVKPEQEIVTGKFYLDPVVAVAKVAGPSVVSISVTEVSRDFFSRPVSKKGEGSGIIYRSDGYIITNNHVVENANSITVVLPNGKTINGSIVGRDSLSDIAVVKVNKTGLTAAKLGDSEKLQVGELAVAIGSPFAFEHTVTAGVISALNRDVQVPSTQEQQFSPTPQDPFHSQIQGGGSKLLENLIQTDAAINPGNSGGALCNKKGEIIGVPSVIFTPSSGSIGIGFAIPVNDAKNIADELIKTGKVSHPWIGITGQTIPPEKAKQLNVPPGVLIRQVFKGQPAQVAGIKAGDIITEFDGRKLSSIDQLRSKVRQLKVGNVVNLTIFRKKKELMIKVKLGEIPKQIQ